jgi:hypothetical protein
MKGKCASSRTTDVQPHGQAITWSDVLLEIDEQILKLQHRIAELKRSRKIVVRKVEGGEPFPIAVQKVPAA